MKALVVNALGRGFDLEDVDIAAPIGREVRVKRASPGLCHTDLLFATHDIVPMPAVLGHEVAGTVAAVGPDAAQVRVGDHVVGSLAQSRRNVRSMSIRSALPVYASGVDGCADRALVHENQLAVVPKELRPDDQNPHRALRQARYGYQQRRVRSVWDIRNDPPREQTE
jgi:S-(hydroxymethyl)glutathione dehydrogenase/alcohol dehydrogenase